MIEVKKQCFRCKEWKDSCDFYKHPQMKDGHLGKCKECAKKDVLEHRNANLERIRAYDRERGKLPHRKQKCKEYARSHPDVISRITRKYRKMNPMAYAAHIIVGNAVRDNKLKKPRKCSECNQKGVMHGHHEDYYKPLDVVWVCVKCHTNLHRKHIKCAV